MTSVQRGVPVEEAVSDEDTEDKQPDHGKTLNKKTMEKVTSFIKKVYNYSKWK